MWSTQTMFLIFAIGHIFNLGPVFFFFFFYTLSIGKFMFFAGEGSLINLCWQLSMTLSQQSRNPFLDRGPSVENLESAESTVIKSLFKINC